jgi:multidrug efflux pump subunit AcrB
MDTSTPRSNDRGILAYFAGNPVAANLMMALMVLGGIAAGFGLTAQVFPTIDPGLITVSVPYPGATPTEVEEGITRRVEEAVYGIDGVERVTSTASENSGTVSIELKDFVDRMRVRNDVEAAVERLADFPPQEAEEPEIELAETLSDVMTLVVSSELSERELRRGAELLEESLLALPSVSTVSLFGARDYEIAIEVREEILRSYGLSIGDVANAIRLSSLNLSSGELRTEAGDVLLRTNNKRYRGDEFEDIVVRALPDGTVLRLGEIADIKDAFADVDLIHQYNGRQSVFVRVQKSEAEDALAIAGDIKTLLAAYESAPGIDIEVWDDQTEVLEDRLGLLLRNGLLGFALVFLFLVVMLDLRLATWVAMGVPISFLGAFLFFDFLGVNLNMVSLFALIIVLGIVVDDAVVVGENIIAEQESGLRGVRAAVAGVTGVMSPVTIGVLTTMAAFAPLLFVTGTFGQILGVVPIVVITVLAMSLLEAFLILPAHLTHGRNWSRWPLDAFQGSVARGINGFRDNWLVPLIAKAVRYRYATLGLAIAFLMLAGSLVATGAVRFIFFPSLESTSMTARLAFPIGTPFQVTQDAAEQIVVAANAVNEDVGGTSFKSVSMTIGGQTSTGGGPGGGGRMSVASHLASVQVQLNSEPLRTLSAAELERLWRQKVGDVPGVEQLTFVSEFFTGSADVSYELAHQDDAVLAEAVEALKSEYRQIPALFEIQDSNNMGKRQYDIALTPAGEAAGLSPADIARQLRRNFFGEEVQRIQRGRQELKVMVRYPEEQRSSIQDFYNVRIRLADGTEAPLSTVATVTESRSFSSIQRVNGLRIVSVSGRVDTAMATPTEVDTDIAQRVLPELKRRFIGLQINQAGFGLEQSRDIASLGQMALIAILVIFALIASQLKSYAQPFIILAGIPFGAAGALIGHYALGYNLSFISIFGMVALSGVVVNDSLVLMDRYNKIRRETGATPIEAVVQAAQRRFRAVFLTTVTTALGLTPMLFETSTQAQFLVPMAVSLATGIVFASVIILLLVPALVVMREDFRRGEDPLVQSATAAG